jgi:hypothetical protein
LAKKAREENCSYSMIRRVTCPLVKSTERWLAFTTDENIRILNKHPHKLFDGTFKIAKSIAGITIIYQMISFHVLVN